MFITNRASCPQRCFLIEKQIGYTHACSAHILYTKIMESILSKQKILKLCALFFVGAMGPVFFMTTDPDKLPLFLLILPFAWIFFVIYMTTQLLVTRSTKAGRKQARIIASLLSSLIVLLFVFQSIHQLSVKDVLISIAIIGIAAVYLLRADFIK